MCSLDSRNGRQGGPPVDRDWAEGDFHMNAFGWIEGDSVAVRTAPARGALR